LFVLAQLGALAVHEANAVCYSLYIKLTANIRFQIEKLRLCSFVEAGIVLIYLSINEPCVVIKLLKKKKKTVMQNGLKRVLSNK